MALIKFGGGVTQMSGSIGGTTFARNRFGNYARARTKPVNPNTSGQQAVRNAFSALTTRWGNALTAVQRTAWDLYGSSVNVLNRLGESVQLTGFNQYLRSNSILLRAGDTVVDAGPTLFELPQADGTFAITISEAAQELSIAFDDALAWNQEDDGHMSIFMGSPQNPQRNFFAGPWKLAGTLDGDLALPLTSPQVIPTPFVATETQHVWAYARIQRADGRLSEPFRDDTFVAA